MDQDNCDNKCHITSLCKADDLEGSPGIENTMEPAAGQAAGNHTHNDPIGSKKRSTNPYRHYNQDNIHINRTELQPKENVNPLHKIIPETDDKYPLTINDTNYDSDISFIFGTDDD